MTVEAAGPIDGVEQLWDRALETIRAELNPPTFKTWFEHTAPLGIEGDSFVVAVQNEFARDWLESRYSGLIRSALQEVTGVPLALDFRIESTVAAHSIVTEPAAARSSAAAVIETRETEAGTTQDSQLDQFLHKLTFDSFVIGASNRFAHAAALAVAEAPGRAYNPLFIFGGVGLGKTHLLHAIGHYVVTNFPHLKVRYVSTEQFTNDFINSIGNKDQRRIDGFRRRYRSIDVLLVDDVQFLKGKEGIQEEFFHTFNTLQLAGKQVVLTSDRPPQEIATLEERLRSRFVGTGLITDIQPPDLETRIAILKRMVEIDKTPVPYDVLAFIADRVSSNIRELEGALIRVTANHRLTKRPLDVELAREVLRDVFPERSSRPVSISTIKSEVSRFYSVSQQELTGGKRSQSIVYPRQVAMYLSRELTDLSLPRIGTEFGGRDHTTVMHAQAKIQKLMNADREVFAQIQTLTNMIRQKA